MITTRPPASAASSATWRPAAPAPTTARSAGSVAVLFEGSASASSRRVPYPASMGLYFRHPSSLLHDTGSHPENASRIRAIEALLEGAGWPGLERRRSRPWPSANGSSGFTIRRLIDAIEGFCAAGGGMIDADTVVVAESWEAALRASGAAATGAERLLAGEAGHAFCGLRPPGSSRRSRDERWASASSITPPSPRLTRSPSAAPNGS